MKNEQKKNIDNDNNKNFQSYRIRGRQEREKEHIKMHGRKTTKRVCNVKKTHTHTQRENAFKGREGDRESH